MITVADLAPLATLQDIGRDGERGTSRLAWTTPVAEAEAWFHKQAAECGLTVERDLAGNLWAVPAMPAPWWGVGSHLDSVRQGGAWDGALGVAAAFAVAGVTPDPVAVIAFADEEGARFNTPTFGSRALAGMLDLPAVLERRDDEGTTLLAALRHAGVDPHRLAAAPAALGRLRGFLELHIDQSTDVAGAGAPVGVVTAIAARARLRVELHGAADHAGTTPIDERRDALSAAAALIVAAETAGPADPLLRRSATRILVEPNAATAIAAEATVWLDARAGSADVVEAWQRDVEAAAAALSPLRRVEIVVHRESASPATVFDPDVVAALRAAAPAGAPDVVCFAGHDAAILATRLPAGMVLVRNATGVSHAPGEHVELDDAAAGADVIARALTTLGAVR